MTRLLGFLALTLFLACPGSAPAEDEVTNQDCNDCHGSEAAKDEGHPPIVAEKDYEASGHSDLACTSCHTDAGEIPHEDDLAAVSLDACTDCHDEAVEAYKEGSHARARENGVTRAPDCAGCHGDIHKVVGHSEDDSPEHWAGLAETCAHCHADAELAKELNLSVVRPVEAYLKSAHALAIREGKRGAVCSDCHEPHRTLPPNDPRSSIWPASVPETCGDCHIEVLDKFQKSVHGQALARGMRDAPSCTDCHGEHRILSHSDADSPVFATNVPRETCGRCHSDTRLVERHGLTDTNWSAFQDSFHGLALRAGEVTAANCSSCHGVHDVLAAEDPESSIHPDNLATTCARCHPGAGERFAVGPVHVSATLAETGLEYWIRLIYLWAIAIVIGGMAVHNAADLVRKARSPAVHHAGQGSLRMPGVLRWQHRLVMVSFPVLAYSGFALTSPESWWAAPLLDAEITYATRGIVHRVAAIVLMAAVSWHVVGIVVSARQRGYMSGMWWAWSDVRHFFAMMAHYVGMRRERPKSAKFSYIEKAEYWAFLWGIVLMAVTGLPLWFENWTLQYFPKWTTDVATTIHFYEAVLATLAILVWHMYWVIFDPDVYPMDKSWWTGHAPPARDEERGISVPEAGRDDHPTGS
ncbi:MAG: cytochrome b/b6 domain-containing protein [Candidatus Binatia bacterium]